VHAYMIGVIGNMKEHSLLWPFSDILRSKRVDRFSE
jgi:hypothetical protein